MVTINLKAIPMLCFGLVCKLIFTCHVQKSVRQSLIKQIFSHFPAYNHNKELQKFERDIENNPSFHNQSQVTEFSNLQNIKPAFMPKKFFSNITECCILLSKSFHLKE